MEQINYLSETLGKLKGISFDEGRLTITFPRTANQQILDAIDTSLVEIEYNSAHEAEIDISKLGFYYYHNEKDFLRRVDKSRWDKLSYLYSENVVYDPTTMESRISSVLDKSYFLINNNHLYFELLIFLKRQEHQEGKIFYFVDYFSWDSRIIVFTTLKKEGKLSISFATGGLELPDDIYLKESLERLQHAFGDSSRNFPKFIKSELIVQLFKYHVNDRMLKFLEEFVAILNIAEQNFEIFLHDLSLENLKKDFIEHKNKYFTQSREILSKLTNQIIGLPITIAASVFSTYKISDSPSTLVIILFVFSLYAIFSIFLLKLQKEDIRDLRSTFLKDYDYIKESPFFVKFDDQLVDFEAAKTQISNRFSHLILAINIYYILFCASVLAFSVYLLLQLAVSAVTIIFLGITSIVIFCILYFTLMK